MKKKIGEIQGKPLVIGDANIVTPNEIHFEEIKKNKDIGESVVIETKDVVDIYYKDSGGTLTMYIVVKSPYTFSIWIHDYNFDNIKQIEIPPSDIIRDSLDCLYVLSVNGAISAQEVNIKATKAVEGEFLMNLRATGIENYNGENVEIVITTEKVALLADSLLMALDKIELPDNLNDLLFLRLTVPPILLEYK